MMHVHIKPLLPINDTSETANKSHKRKTKPVSGLYRSPIMVPIHQVGNSDQRKGSSDGILYKVMSECKGSDRILKQVKDSSRQPIVIDLETSGSSSHSSYNGSSYSGYIPSSEGISSHMSNHNSASNNNNNNNSPVISLSDNHSSPSTAPHEQGRGVQHRSSTSHQHHHQQQRQHRQQQRQPQQQQHPHFTDIHDQMQTFPRITSLASQEASFVTSTHRHATSEALTSEHPSSVNDYKLYYSQGTNAIRSISPLPSVGNIEREIHCYQPCLNTTNNVNQNVPNSLNFSPLRQ